jgi:hypothetical protein
MKNNCLKTLNSIRQQFVQNVTGCCAKTGKPPILGGPCWPEKFDSRARRRRQGDLMFS